MVVNTDQIKENGLELNESVSAKFLDEALGEVAGGFKAAGAATLKAKLHKLSGGVLLEGGLVAEVTAPCKRCVKDVKMQVPVSFTLNLVPRSMLVDEGREADAEDDENGERGGSFDLTDANHEVFEGKTIDLDPIVREQVLLALPISVVCNEDCKGLCSVCGQNLNERECGCERKVLDPRLAALKDIKLN